jgi:hypothetical protein
MPVQRPTISAICSASTSSFTSASPRPDAVERLLGVGELLLQLAQLAVADAGRGLQIAPALGLLELDLLGVDLSLMP